MTDRLEQRIVELYVEGLSSRLVAVELGVAKSTVLRVLKAAGVPSPPTGAAVLIRRLTFRSTLPSKL